MKKQNPNQYQIEKPNLQDPLKLFDNAAPISISQIDAQIPNTSSQMQNNYPNWNENNSYIPSFQNQQNVIGNQGISMQQPPYNQNANQIKKTNTLNYVNQSSHKEGFYQGLTGSNLASQNKYPQQPICQPQPQIRPQVKSQMQPQMQQPQYRQQVMPQIQPQMQQQQIRYVIPQNQQVYVQPQPVIINQVPIYVRPPCPNCGGTGFKFNGTRCVCNGGIPGLSNDELVGIGLMSRGCYGRPFGFGLGYW